MITPTNSNVINATVALFRKYFLSICRTSHRHLTIKKNINDCAPFPPNAIFPPGLHKSSRANICPFYTTLLTDKLRNKEADEGSIIAICRVRVLSITNRTQQMLRTTLCHRGIDGVEQVSIISYYTLPDCCQEAFVHEPFASLLASPSPPPM